MLSHAGKKGDLNSLLKQFQKQDFNAEEYPWCPAMGILLQ